MLLWAIRLTIAARERVEQPVGVILDGIRYIWRSKLILGCMSLDLFAVLLGGATALLPVYAREILHTGPNGLGVLRAASGMGSVLVALLLAHYPLRRRAGVRMLYCVAGFGVFTVVFGLSHSFTLSLIALMLTGAFDMVSVIVRSTLIQLTTPDEMRGRVSAVYMLFIGASNEVGQFESGITAQWFGTVPAVVLGGVGTIVVVGLWSWLFPQLRRVDKLGVMTGSIVQVNVSPGGIPKRPIAQAEVTPEGIRGDSWAHPQIHGGPRQAVLLITSEGIDELIAQGYPLYAGALGENFTLTGLDRREMRIGQRYRVGYVLIELTKVRTPCTTLDVYGPSIKQAVYDCRSESGGRSIAALGIKRVLCARASGRYCAAARYNSVSRPSRLTEWLACSKLSRPARPLTFAERRRSYLSACLQKSKIS